MIELFEQNERKADRQSSKGNQLKWENNGIWYKADCTGYEGLAEYMMTGRLLRWSVCSTIFSRRVCMRLYGIYNLRWKIGSIFW